MPVTSDFLSQLMDKMGYSAKMIRYRQETYRKLDKLSNANNTDGPCSRFTTGGKAEGIARYFESDIDHMHIVKDVVCTDEPMYFERANRLTLFKVESKNTPPGYVRLKLLKQNGAYLREELNASLFQSHEGDTFISSIKFTENIKESMIWLPGFTTQEKTGPSSPVSNGYLSIDRVVSFNCFLPAEQVKWKQTSVSNRRNGTIGDIDISWFEAHAVPVGNNMSPDKYLEWRMSYTKVELYLISSLSLIKLKVYVLLKIIARTVFKPLCQEATSYLMKNVILWLCGPNSPHYCRSKNILELLQSCLNFFRTCLFANYLPSFTIPSRNLLQGRVGLHERRNLITAATELLDLGPAMIFCCKKIKSAVKAMQKIPETFTSYGQYRDEIEKMILVLCECRARLRTPGVTQEQYDKKLLQDDTYRETKLKILTSIGLLSPSADDSQADLEDLIKTTKGKYYERLSQMLS